MYYYVRATTTLNASIVFAWMIGYDKYCLENNHRHIYVIIRRTRISYIFIYICVCVCLSDVSHKCTLCYNYFELSNILFSTVDSSRVGTAWGGTNT